MFGRQGEQSIDWDNTQPYEPLTIVSYQGNSYTSRQYVPAGIPITNEAYWALTGNFNAQIDAYRAEVARFDGRITANEDGLEQARTDIDNLTNDVVIIGDSWASDSNPSLPTWANTFEADYRGNVYNFAYGGARIADTSSENYFTGQVNQAMNDTSIDPDKVGTVLFVGGINDYRHASSQVNIASTVANKLNELIATMKTRFSNAKYIVVLNHQIWVSYNLYRYIEVIKAAVAPSAIVVSTLGWFRASIHYRSDFLHLNGAGSNVMLQNMKSLICGTGVLNYQEQYFSFNLTTNDAKVFRVLFHSFMNDNGTLCGQLAFRQTSGELTNGTYRFNLTRTGTTETSGFEIDSYTNENIFAIPNLFSILGAYPADTLTNGNESRVSYGIGNNDEDTLGQVTAMNIVMKTSANSDLNTWYKSPITMAYPLAVS